MRRRSVKMKRGKEKPEGKKRDIILRRSTGTAKTKRAPLDH